MMHWLQLVSLANSQSSGSAFSDLAKVQKELADLRNEVRNRSRTPKPRSKGRGGRRTLPAPSGSSNQSQNKSRGRGKKGGGKGGRNRSGKAASRGSLVFRRFAPWWLQGRGDVSRKEREQWDLFCISREEMRANELRTASHLHWLRRCEALQLLSLPSAEDRCPHKCICLNSPYEYGDFHRYSCCLPVFTNCKD